MKTKNLKMLLVPICVGLAFLHRTAFNLVFPFEIFPLEMIIANVVVLYSLILFCKNVEISDFLSVLACVFLIIIGTILAVYLVSVYYICRNGVNTVFDVYCFYYWAISSILTNSFIIFVVLSLKWAREKWVREKLSLKWVREKLFPSGWHIKQPRKKMN